MKTLISLVLALGLAATSSFAADTDKAPETKKNPNEVKVGPKPVKLAKPTAEVPPQPLPPTVADGVDGKQPPAPPNKIDPSKPLSPLVAPKAPLASGEPPGGFPKQPEPEQPKGNIDPAKLQAVTVYSYKNDKGAEVFADNLDAVPKQFRDKDRKVQRK